MRLALAVDISWHHSEAFGLMLRPGIGVLCSGPSRNLGLMLNRQQCATES